MTLETPQKSLLLVVDPTPTFAPILKIALRRGGHEVETVAFQRTGMAVFWLSGQMDRRKAAKRPLPSLWDDYPEFRPPTLAIVSLAFPAVACNRVLALLMLQEPRPHLVTTSTEEELAANQSYAYWRHIAAHLPRPLIMDEVRQRLTPLLPE